MKLEHYYTWFHPTFWYSEVFLFSVDLPVLMKRLLLVLLFGHGCGWSGVTSWLIWSMLWLFICHFHICSRTFPSWIHLPLYKQTHLHFCHSLFSLSGLQSQDPELCCGGMGAVQRGPLPGVAWAIPQSGRKAVPYHIVPPRGSSSGLLLSSAWWMIL